MSAASCLPEMYSSHEMSDQASTAEITRILPVPPPHRLSRVRSHIPPPLMRHPQWSYHPGGLNSHAYPSPPMTTSPVSPKRQQFLDERHAQHPSQHQHQHQYQYQHQQSHQHQHQTPQTHQYPYGHPHEHIQSATSAPNLEYNRTTQMAAAVHPASAGPPPHGYSHYAPQGYIDQQHPNLQPRPRAQSIPPYQHNYPATAYAQPGMMAGQPEPSHMGHYLGPVTMPAVVGRIAKSGSRRAKAHVARACQNCKKAHLSCDEQRPCSRCVSTRRESTCIDVAHKKRGRPRIQPERESMGIPRGPPAIVPPSYPAMMSDTQPRMLRSQQYPVTDRRGSLPVDTSSYPQSYAHPHQRSQQQSQFQLDPRLGQGPQSASADITSFRFSEHHTLGRSRTDSQPLVLFLSMDLKILKVLDHPRPILDNNDLKDVLLRDILDPKHHDTLGRLKLDLDNESSRREPMKLPSISSILSPQLHQAIDQLTPSDVPRVTEASQVDFNDTWTFTLSRGRSETFHSRVTLAKSGVFFVVVELQRIATASSQTSEMSQHYPVGPPAELFERRSPPSAQHSSLRESNHPPATAPVSPFAHSQPVSPYTNMPAQFGTSLPQTSPRTLLPSAHPLVSPGSEQTFGSSSYFPRQSGSIATSTGNYPSSSLAPMQPPPNPISSALPQSQRSNPTHEVRRPEPLSNIQLAPILSASAPTTPIGSSFLDSQSGSGRQQVLSTPTMTTPQYQQGSSSAPQNSPGDLSDEDSARKRRRLNIGEIIE